MITLRGITWENPRGHDPLVAAAREWSLLHPGVHIQWEQLPWYLFEDNILASLSAGDGRYDLVMFDHPWVGVLAQARWLRPWDEFLDIDYITQLRERVVAPSVESYEWAGHLWAMPLDAACHASLYRDDLLAANDLPRTWEDVVGWARAHHDPPRQYGLVLSLEGVLGHCLFLSMMAGLGHPAFHDPFNPQCDYHAADYVLNLLKDLLEFVPPGSVEWGPWDIYHHLVNHDDVSYSPSIFAYVNYFEGMPQSKHLRLGTVPAFPGKRPGRPILGGVGLGIAHTCDHVREAMAYGQFLMSDEIQRQVFTNHSGQPATYAVWHDPRINKRFNDFYSILEQNMNQAYIRPRYPAFHALELRNGEILQQLWAGKMSVSEVIRELNKPNSFPGDEGS